MPRGKPSSTRLERGVFITFEGGEGSGKTTQASRLAKLLREEGHRVVETREPGGTPLAEGIREIILSSPAEPMVPPCEALLILAGRSQHMARVIQPALNSGEVVICDRFSDSTFAYQGHARGLDLASLRPMDRFATGGVKPDLTVLIDVPVSIGLARRGRHEKRRDRLDMETQRFHEKVRSGYLDLAAKEPGRVKVVDGKPDPDIVATKVASVVLQFINKRARPKTAAKTSQGRKVAKSRRR